MAITFNHNDKLYVSGSNVGIGTDSPAEKLHVNSGNIRLKSSSDGSNGILALYDSSNTESGQIYPHSGDIRIYSPNDVLFNNAGNVGIGTTSPSTSLHVVKDASWEVARFEADSYPTATVYSQAAAKYAQLNIYDTRINSEPTMELRADTPHFNIRLDDTGNVLTIRDGGNVGIGTTSPAVNLHVHESGSGDVYTMYSNDTTGVTVGNGSLIGINSSEQFMIWNYESSPMRFATSGSERMRIASGGNVGIGTTSPSEKLHIGSGTVPAATLDGVLLTLGTGQYYQASDGTKTVFMGVDASSYGIVGTLTNHALGFRTDNTERMRITSGGNVGIGTTSPNAKLHVYGGGNTIFEAPADTDVDIRYRSNGTNKYNMFYQASTDGWGLYYNPSTAYRLFVNSSGNVGIGTSSPENKLHLLTSTTDATQQLLIQNGSTGDAAIKFNISGETYSVGIDNSDSNKFKISDGNLGTNDRIVIDSAGNVGIGITSPATDLSLGNATHTSPDDTDRILNWYASTGGDEISNSSHYITVGQNSSNTSQPKSVGLALFNSNTANNTYSPAITFGGLSTSGDYMTGAGAISTQLIANADDNNFRGGDLTFYTSGTTSATRGLNEKMRITSGGNVGIGTTSPQDLLHLSASSPVLRLTNTSDTGKSSIEFWDNQGGTSQSGEIFYEDSGNVFGLQGNANGIIFKASNTFPGSELMRLTSSGNLGIGTTSPKTQLHLNDGGSYNNTDANNRLFIERDNHAYILMSTPDDKDQGIHFRNDTDNANVGRIAYQHRSTGDSLRFRVGSTSNNNEFLIINSDGSLDFKGYGAGGIKGDAF